MAKKQNIRIKSLHEVKVKNVGSYGGMVEIILSGANSKGTLIEVKIDAEMYYAIHLSWLFKKAVVNFSNRVNDEKLRLDRQLNEVK